jgi:quinol monooxygenase YgiN
MFVIRVLARFDPDRRQEALDQLAREAAEVPARFPGCRHFQAYVEPGDANQMLIYEEWDDQAAFDAYRTSDYFTEGGKVVFPAIVGAPESAYYAAELVGP